MEWNVYNVFLNFCHLREHGCLQVCAVSANCCLSMFMYDLFHMECNVMLCYVMLCYVVVLGFCILEFCL
jgi:hypothetical protein